MGRRLKNYTLIEVTDDQREAVQAAYRALRTYTGDAAACRTCQRPTTRPSRLCSVCAGMCKHPTSLAAYIVVRNGATQPKEFCLECGGVWGVQKGKALLDIELENRVTDRHAEPRPCARCGNRDGTELHHWAPQAIFEDAHWWPTDYLCRECHRFWHRWVRSAGGYRLQDRVHRPDYELGIFPESVR